MNYWKQASSKPAPLWTLEKLGVVCAIDSNGAVVVKLSSRCLSDDEHSAVQTEMDKRREHNLTHAKERPSWSGRKNVRKEKDKRTKYNFVLIKS